MWKFVITVRWTKCMKRQYLNILQESMNDPEVWRARRQRQLNTGWYGHAAPRKCFNIWTRVYMVANTQREIFLKIILWFKYSIRYLEVMKLQVITVSACYLLWCLDLDLIYFILMFKYKLNTEATLGSRRFDVRTK